MTVATSNLRANEGGYQPPDGFIPDSTTAVAVAEAILIGVYGKTQIERQRPMIASLEGKAWVVAGTLRRGELGGVATIRLDKETGTVLRVMHGK